MIKGEVGLEDKTGAAHIPEGKKEGKKIPFEKKLMTAALIGAILSFAGCTVLTIQEYIVLDQGIRMNSAPVKSVKKNVDERAAAPINMLKLLPRKIEDYNVEAHQLVPGEKKYAAEAIYGTTEDGVIPYNSYIKVTYFEDPEEASDVIKSNLKLRYPASAAVATRDGFEVHSGYDQEHASYYLGFIIDQYLFEIHTNYLSAVPSEQENRLETSAGIVFSEATKQAVKVLGR